MATFRFIGRGLYSVPEAHRLTGVPAARIRRWIHGYEFWDRRGELHVSDAVVRSQGAPSPAIATLFFSDMIEVRFVNQLRRLGVSWPTIRKAAIAAAAELQTDHPFASRRLTTDGSAVFLKLGDTVLMDIVTKQYAWRRILRAFLRDLDFSATDQASRWWPLGRQRRVVVDPERSFGSPIVVERVPTWVLAAATRAEGSARRAADAYEVSSASVRDAVLFERRHGLTPRRA
jgi:uncharacterized protein (DUF433 family)